MAMSRSPNSSISLIAAAAANDVIGREGALPWRLPDDLQRFKQLTMGKPLVMGRLTHESIGRALPGRKNIVLSRQPNFVAEGCLKANTLEDAIALSGEAPEIMVIGGGMVYELFLPLATRIYLTRVHAVVEGDAYFPQLDSTQWEVVDRDDGPSGGEGPRVTYLVMERRSSSDAHR